MKKIALILVLIVAFGVGIIKFSQKNDSVATLTPIQTSNDYKNIAYQIEDQEILLKNGVAETRIAPDLEENVDTEYFGNDVRGDFNRDGTEDVAFILTQSGSWTGVFFYVVVAIKTSNGYKGTNAILLGDRIAPQTIEFKNNEIIVNYADRKPSEPFSEEPSVGVSKYLKIDGLQLLEVSG